MHFDAELIANCEHEWEPYSSELIVVSDEEFAANPLGNFTPPRYVPCKKCGGPIDRGRYDRMISVPALAADWPFGRDDD